MSLKDPLSAMRTPKIAKSSSSSASAPLDSIQTPDPDDAADAVREIAASILPPDEVDDAVRQYLLHVHERHLSGEEHPDEVTDGECASFFRGFATALGRGSSSSSSSSSSGSLEDPDWAKAPADQDPKRKPLRDLAAAIHGGPAEG